MYIYPNTYAQVIDRSEVDVPENPVVGAIAELPSDDSSNANGNEGASAQDAVQLIDGAYHMDIGTSFSMNVTAEAPIDHGHVKITTSRLPDGLTFSECLEGVQGGGYSIDQKCTANVEWTPGETGAYTVFFITRTLSGIDSAPVTAEFVISMPPPRIGSVASEDGWPQEGGVVIRIDGEYFGEVKNLVAVSVGYQTCSITGRSETHIECVLPAGHGTHDLHVVVDDAKSDPWVVTYLSMTAGLDAESNLMVCKVTGTCYKVKNNILVQEDDLSIDDMVVTYAPLHAGHPVPLPSGDSISVSHAEEFVYITAEGVHYNSGRSIC